MSPTSVAAASRAARSVSSTATLTGVVLVVAGHLLGQLPAALVLEHDEVPDEVEEPPPPEDAFEYDLQLGQPGCRILAAGDRPPGFEPLLPRPEGTDSSLDAVGDDKRLVVVEESRNLRLVSLELLEGRTDGGVLVGRILELDDREGQAVHEQDDVRPARVLTFGDRKLVDREPVVVLGIIEVDHARLVTGDGAVGAAVLDRDAVHEHAVYGTVALQQRRNIGPGELAEGVFQRLGRQVGIEGDQGFAETTLQDHVAVVRVGAFGGGLAGGDVGAVEDCVAEGREPGEGGRLRRRIR